MYLFSYFLASAGCMRNSLYWLLYIFYKMSFFLLRYRIFLLFLHLCNRNSLAGFVHFVQNHFYCLIAPTVCRRNLFSDYGNIFAIKKIYIFEFYYAYVRETHYLTFRHVHPFSSWSLNNPFVLLDIERVYLYCVSLPFR